MCCRADIERGELLIETVDNFVAEHVTHYVIVDKRDYDHFAHLNTGRRKVLQVEDILPWWIMRVPKARRWWLSLKSVPLRNWFLQQIVKLSLSQSVEDDVLIFIDADVAFFRPFDPKDWVKDGKVRLFRVPDANPTTHTEWHKTAGSVLGLGEQDYFGASYIGNLIPWRRENVLHMYKHISEKSGKGWQETICSRWHLSEYVLYGVYIDKVLGEENSGHYYDDCNPCHTYWGTEALSEEQLREFLGKVDDSHVSIMISSKAGITPTQYRSLLKDLQ
tara:strand:- start:877 stop:1704 length:828 start_codon:yes stop_codon:yes gene_type:complete